MKICWDNLEKLRYSKRTGKWYDKKKHVYILKICECCEEEYLGRKESRFCCSGCIRKGAKHTEESINRIRKAKKGTKHTKETRKKMSKAHEGKKFPESFGQKIRKRQNGKGNTNWKGGYHQKGIPIYDTYAPKLEWCEKVRRNKQDPKVLEVQCFKCNEWYIPKLWTIRNRLRALRNKLNNDSEYHLYCSKECKNSCSIYHKSVKSIMREDAIRAGRLSWLELSREVQSELRKLVLERDKYQCVKCGKTKNIQCHHIYPVSIEFIESADIDNCITLCKNCHIKVHQKDGCKYGQLQIETC